MQCTITYQVAVIACSKARQLSEMCLRWTDTRDIRQAAGWLLFTIVGCGRPKCKIVIGNRVYYNGWITHRLMHVTGGGSNTQFLRCGCGTLFIKHEVNLGLQVQLVCRNECKCVSTCAQPGKGW